jgi:membrane associated rhomboid family serine protease
VDVPVCYRHPDRETYIRCTRCERPICPDCMTSASVGFQCPECVAQGAASVPPVRTRLGAKVPTRPYVTFTLIGLCVAAFGAEMVTGVDSVAGDWALWPNGMAVGDQYYRLVTAMFLHENLLHIGFNMLVLWLLGPQLESVLGHVRYAVLYLVAGVGGCVASFWFNDPNGLSLGASGAIFGLMGAYLVVGRALRADVSQVLGLIVLNLVLGFVIPNTDWRAHLGGLAVGAAVGAIFAFAPARHRIVVQVVGVVGVLALLAVAVVVRDNVLTQHLIDAGFDVSRLA